MVSLCRILSLLLVATAVYFAVLNLYDFDQCTRKCNLTNEHKRDDYENYSYSHRVGFLKPFRYRPDGCMCFNPVVRFVTRHNEPTRSYSKIDSDPDAPVCIRIGSEGSPSTVLRSEFPESKSDSEPSSKFLHSGACGQCSNDHDIDVLNRTRLTLTNSAWRCGLMYLLFGRSSAEKCMSSSVGFTPSCRRCWVDNMACSASHCLWTCGKATIENKVREMMLSSSSEEEEQQQYNLEDGGGADDQKLPACLQCDEDFCGPMFLECAGANRRKCGILTDIERPMDQVAPTTDTEVMTGMVTDVADSDPDEL